MVLFCTCLLMAASIVVHFHWRVKLIYCSCLIRITYVNKYCFVLESKISTCNSAKLSTCAYIYIISRESERGKNKQKFIEAVAFMKINCTSFEVFHMGFILCIYAKPKALDKPMQIQFMCHIHTLLCYNWRFVNFWLEIFYRRIWCLFLLFIDVFILFVSVLNQLHPISIYLYIVYISVLLVVFHMMNEG